VNNNCGFKQTMQNSSQALHYSWSSSNSAILQINGSSTNSSVNVNGASVGTATMTGTVSATYFGPPGTCTFQGSGPTNVATMSCSTVMRGSSTTCSVTNAPNGSTFNSWSFKDSTGNTVTGTGTGSSWSGTMVTSGTVSVNVVTNGSSSPVSTSVTVNNRSGSAWTFNPASATQENNGFSCSASGPVLSIPSPPSATFSEDGTQQGDLGAYCNTDGAAFNTATVNDGGPNNGYQYLTSVTAGSTNLTWGYYYVISPDLQNSSSAFSLAQCGNYNAQSNPNGYITQPNLANKLRAMNPEARRATMLNTLRL